MPGRRRSCTYIGAPLTLPGISRRGTDWPTIPCRPAGFGRTVAVASRLRSSDATSSAYVTVLRFAALITPSATLSESALIPSRADASSTRMPRTSAAAMRSAVPEFSTDCEPAVMPSFGVRPVSPETIETRASGRSSSSAAICRSAVRMPCPSSTLPVNTVALPSGSIRIQASSLRLPPRLPGS